MARGKRNKTHKTGSKMAGKIKNGIFERYKDMPIFNYVKIGF